MLGRAFQGKLKASSDHARNGDILVQLFPPQRIAVQFESHVFQLLRRRVYEPLKPIRRKAEIAAIRQTIRCSIQTRTARGSVACRSSTVMLMKPLQQILLILENQALNLPNVERSDSAIAGQLHRLDPKLAPPSKLRT